MVFTYLLLIVGFGALLWGADVLVAGASALARKLRISEAIIGLTIVAFGTSMPEFVVNVSAAIEGSGDIALANVIGSNVFNILAILGCSALVLPLAVDRDRRCIDIPIAIGSAVAVLLLSQDYLLCHVGQFGKALLSPETVTFTEPESVLSRVDGVILLVLFSGFMVYIVRSSMKNRKEEDAQTEEKSAPYWMVTLKIVGGLFLLVAGGRVIVKSAVEIAEYWGVSQRVIGLTIVSIGTSLPELATSVVAAFRKQADIAVTNIVGSNIFNALFILGATAVIRPVTVTSYSLFDIVLNLVVSVAILLIAFGPKHRIGRIPAVVMLAAYVAYVIYLI